MALLLARFLHLIEKKPLNLSSPFPLHRLVEVGPSRPEASGFLIFVTIISKILGFNL